LRDLVIACCRVAQKNHNLVVDEQTKDFWRWKDTIIHYEDLLLEVLCFDLTIESPHILFFTLMKRYGVSGNKTLRNAAWSFLNDSSLTPLCLLFPSRTIAIFGLMYGACKEGPTKLADDEHGRPWWESEGVSLAEMHKAVAIMSDFYEKYPQKPGGSSSVFVECLTDERLEETRRSNSQARGTPDSSQPLSGYATDDWGGASSRSKRRSEEVDEMDVDDRPSASRPSKRFKSVEMAEAEEILTPKNGNGDHESESGHGSEEGEI
jgi:protein BUR2